MTDTERERIKAICEIAGVSDIENLSDGFHTFAQPEIIRCKDCIYYRQEIDMCDEPYSTAHNVVHEDDYCSRAKRRTE